MPHFLTVRAVSWCIMAMLHGVACSGPSCVSCCMSCAVCCCVLLLHVYCSMCNQSNAMRTAARALLCVPLWVCAPQALHDPLEEMEALAAASGIKGCAYCGGLGHRIADCPKLRSESKAQERSKKDYFGSGGFGGEM